MPQNLLCINATAQLSGLIKQKLMNEVNIDFTDTINFNQNLNKYSLVIVYFDLAQNIDLSEMRELRDFYPEIPLIIATEYHDKHVYFKLIDLGVDNFITLASPTELIIDQIKKMLRKKPANKSYVYEIGDILLNKQNRSMIKDHNEIYLKSKEFSIMEKLARHQNKIMDRYKLMPPELRESLNPDSARSSVDTHVSRIRKKLSKIGSDSKIKTVYGLGYKFQYQ